MSPHLLLAALLACHTAPPPPGLAPADPLADRVYDLGALTERQADGLEGRRALYRVTLDGEPDDRDDDGAVHDCAGSGEGLRTVWLCPGEPARRTMTVEAVLRWVRHPLLRGADGPWLPALVEYRLTDARTVVARAKATRRGRCRGTSLSANPAAFTTCSTFSASTPARTSRPRPSPGTSRRPPYRRRSPLPAGA
jgi:hypothetical protein